MFVQKVVPDTDLLLVRRASDGERVCQVRSVDGSTITAFCIHECEGSSRMASRPRRSVALGTRLARRWETVLWPGRVPCVGGFFSGGGH